MKPIFFSDPLAQFYSHREEILAAVDRVLTHGPYILGPEVEAFEAEFAAYHGVSHAVGLGSGTDALALTLRAYDIGPGDEVITVAHTALATVAAIVMAGATPVCVDIEPDFYTLDPQKLEEMVTPRTKAIIPVHLYGQPCDMTPILKFAHQHGLKVIEDCAQAHGATYAGNKVGTLGHAGCFSFYPTKNLGAIGDGGGVVTNDQALADRLKQMRQYGWDAQRVGQELGVVSRLDALQAAILRVKLKDLDKDNEKRRILAAAYATALQDSEWVLPCVRENTGQVYHLYVVQAAERARVKNKLHAQGIEAGIHYAVPAHLHPGYGSRIVLPSKGLPVTEAVAARVLSLPMYPELDRDIVSKVKEVLCPQNL